jgi:hypothetical protein
MKRDKNRTETKKSKEGCRKKIQVDIGTMIFMANEAIDGAREKLGK